MKVAGSVSTPRYVLNIQPYRVFPGRYGMTNPIWRPMNGRPSSQNIKRYVNKFNLSLEPRGANAHVGREMAIWGADIIDQFSGETVATWADRVIIQSYKSKPMFEVVAKVAGYEIQIGEKVKYSRNFLRSIGDYTDLAHWVGVVREIRPIGGITLAEVAWDNGETTKVNIKNLVAVSRLHLEPV
jgi:hypothetical protein